MRIIGIVGSRRRNGPKDFEAVKRAFFDTVKKEDWICSGGCPQGADKFAESLSRNEGIPILIFPADWKQFGKAAGFIRNTDIAMKSDILIACVAEDRKGGTEDTIAKFKKWHPDGKLILV